MPKIRRRNLPNAVFQHLLDRVDQRQITEEQLELLANWLDQQPDVPSGPWFKRFPHLTVCGEGELIKTFLTSQQIPFGQEVPNPTPKPAVATPKPSPPPPKPKKPDEPPLIME